MSTETISIWMAIGLVAGWLASRVTGGGYGVVGDIVLGIVGAFLGGFIFRALHLRMPFSGVAVDDIRRLRGRRCPVAAHAAGGADLRARQMSGGSA